MSIFASRTEKTIPIPFDPPHEVTIRKLAGRHLERAKQEGQIKSVDWIRKLGGAEFSRELSALGDPAERAAALEKRKAEVRADPLQKFDRTVVLEKGIVRWTYPEPVTPEALEDLEEEAGEWLAREILALTFPHGAGAEEKKT